MDYLGNTLTSAGIEPQVKKILPILRFTRPVNKKQLKSFLGFVNYYKKYWHHRSHEIEPLTRITSTKVNFKWTNAQTTAFNRIKQIMARKILLTYPDFTKTFHLFTDASDIQLGGVIVQEGSHRSILVGFPLVFHSDHKNLSFDTFKSERVSRWRLLLEEYIYEFVYTPGKANIIADMISRYPMQPISKDDIVEVNTLSPDDDYMPVDYALIESRQAADSKLQSKLSQGVYITTTISGFNLATYKDKVVIPDSLIMPFIRWYHEKLKSSWSRAHLPNHITVFFPPRAFISHVKIRQKLLNLSEMEAPRPSIRQNSRPHHPIPTLGMHSD